MDHQLQRYRSDGGRICRDTNADASSNCCKRISAVDWDCSVAATDIWGRPLRGRCRVRCSYVHLPQCSRRALVRLRKDCKIVFQSQTYKSTTGVSRGNCVLDSSWFAMAWRHADGNALNRSVHHLSGAWQTNAYCRGDFGRVVSDWRGVGSIFGRDAMSGGCLCCEGQVFNAL